MELTQLTQEDVVLQVEQMLQSAVIQEERTKREVSNARTQHEKFAHRQDVAEELVDYTEHRVESINAEIKEVKAEADIEVRIRNAYADVATEHKQKRTDALASGSQSDAQWHQLCHDLAISKAVRHHARLYRSKDLERELYDELGQTIKLLEERKARLTTTTGHVQGLERQVSACLTRQRIANAALNEARLTYDEQMASLGVSDSSVVAIARWHLKLAEWAQIPKEYRNDVVVHHANDETLHLYFGFSGKRWSRNDSHGHVVVQHNVITYRRMPRTRNGTQNSCRVPLTEPRPTRL